MPSIIPQEKKCSAVQILLLKRSFNNQRIGAFGLPTMVPDKFVSVY